MLKAEELADYVANLRALLTQNEARYAMMVERQVQFGLLPKLQGSRAQLESHLWNLLVLCLDGHEAVVPPCEQALYDKAQSAAVAGQNTHGAKARFPRAAKAVCTVLQVVREFGVYPKPRLKTA